MDKNKRIRKMRDWCIDCIFKKYGKRYYTSRTKGPSEIDCMQCFYDKFGQKKVGKPSHWRKGKKQVETAKPQGRTKVIDHEGCIESIGGVDNEREPPTPQPGLEEEETEEEYQPDHEAQKRIIEKRLSYEKACYDCHREINTNRDVCLMSQPHIFGIRIRCLECGKWFQRTLKAEFRERWLNV